MSVLEACKRGPHMLVLIRHQGQIERMLLGRLGLQQPLKACVEEGATWPDAVSNKPAEPRAAEDSPEQSEEKSISIFLFAAARSKQYMSLNGLRSESIIGTLGQRHRKWQCTRAVSSVGNIRDNTHVCQLLVGRTPHVM